MEEELKAHFKELYKRQETELNKLSSLRMDLFQKGNYKYLNTLQILESCLSDMNRRIANTLEDDYLSVNELRFLNKGHPLDNVD